MTAEDKQLIAEYMGWKIDKDFKFYFRRKTLRSIVRLPINFDLNDAGLCVEKMVENYDIADFQSFITDLMQEFVIKNGTKKYVLEWVFNSDNFFSAMTAWRREK